MIVFWAVTLLWIISWFRRLGGTCCFQL